MNTLAMEVSKLYPEIKQLVCLQWYKYIKYHLDFWHSMIGNCARMGDKQ